MKGASIIEWSDSGARFGLSLPQYGAWEVTVPRDVAMDGWAAETGAAASNDADLCDWVDRHYLEFAEMVAGRFDVRYSERSDDPRVLASRCLLNAD